MSLATKEAGPITKIEAPSATLFPMTSFGPPAPAKKEPPPSRTQTPTAEESQIKTNTRFPHLNYVVDNNDFVPVCLFQHLGKCGGKYIINGLFCSSHHRLFYNGIFKNTHNFINDGTGTKIVHSHLLHTLIPYPPISLYKTNNLEFSFPLIENLPDNFTVEDIYLIASSEYLPMRDFIYRLLKSELNQSEQLHFNNWKLYASSVMREVIKANKDWLLMGPNTYNLLECSLLTQTYCLSMTSNMAILGGNAVSYPATIGEYVPGSFVINRGEQSIGTIREGKIESLGTIIYAPITQTISANYKDFNEKYFMCVSYGTSSAPKYSVNPYL